ncbi:hypothetical protein ACOSQ4_014070 [Xanthoceras sorbifolium]
MFCGTCQGHGYHEDGLKSSLIAAYGLLGKSCAISTRKSCAISTNTRRCMVMIEADISLADLYINGDFSFEDKDEGLLKLIMGNDFFAMFLDESLTLAYAVFKSEDEDLKVAQMRKNSLLIEKARINEKHEVLELGCGWGTLAIETVKRTGCKYTGINIVEEQLKYEEMKAKEAGLQDHIKFLFCDYRQLPKTHKYDRIIACGMIDAIGHEHLEEFFGFCESILA